MQNLWEGWLEVLRSHISFLAEEPNKCKSFDLEDNSHFLHKLEHTGMRRLQFTDSGSLDHIITQQTILPSPHHSLLDGYKRILGLCPTPSRSLISISRTQESDRWSQELSVFKTRHLQLDYKYFLQVLPVLLIKHLSQHNNVTFSHWTNAWGKSCASELVQTKQCYNGRKE